MQPKIRTTDVILREIESIVAEKHIGYIDAVILYCEENNLEPDAVGEIIKSSALIRLKIQVEAEDLNFLPKPNRLPI